MRQIKNNDNDDEKKDNNRGEENEYIKNLSIIEGNEIIMKDTKYYKEKLKKLFKKTPLFIAFLLVYLLYFLSLEGCYEGEGICTTQIDWIFLKVKEEVISCFIMSILLQLIFFKIIPKIHSIHFIIVFIFFFNYSHGMTFDDHGYFNFIFYFIIIGVIIFILFPFDLLIYNFKGKKRIIIILIYTCIFIMTICIIMIGGANCSEWPKGLNNTYLDAKNLDDTILTDYLIAFMVY